MSFELSLLGLLVSAVFIGIWGVYPGGIIVPSYLVLFLDQPLRILATLLISFLTLACFKGLSRFALLFGKRRFVFMIVTAALWTYAWSVFFPSILPLPMEFRVIGWVIPGLIANHLHKQGILLTISSLAVVTVFTYLLGAVFSRIQGI